MDSLNAKQIPQARGNLPAMPDHQALISEFLP